MSSSHSAYSAFSEVDELVSKPVLGSDGAASWQDFQKSRAKSGGARGNAAASSTNSTGAAPHLPVKRSDRLGTGLSSISEERLHEERVRREAGDAPLGSGYTAFRKKGLNAEEAAARKKARLIAERIRPDDKPYFLRAETFGGWKEDYVFTTRDRGTGYYWDGMDSAKRQMGLPPVGGGEKADSGGGKDVPAGEEGGSRAADDQHGDAADTRKIQKNLKSRGKDKSDDSKKKKKARNGDDGGSGEGVPDAAADDSNKPMEQVAAAMRRMNERTAAAMAPPNYLRQGVGAGAGSGVAAPVATSDYVGWESAVEPTSGKIYYFRRATGDTSWTWPPKTGNVGGSTTATATATEGTSAPKEKATIGAAEGKEEEEKKGKDPSERRDARSSGAGGEGSESSEQEVHAALPNGWKLAKDPRSGRTYYHHIGGKTSWERPTA